MVQLTSVVAIIGTLGSTVLVAASEPEPMPPSNMPPPATCTTPIWEIESVTWTNSSSSLNCYGEDNGTPECQFKIPGSNNKYEVFEPISKEDCEYNHSGTWLDDACDRFGTKQPWGYGPPANLRIKFKSGFEDCSDGFQDSYHSSTQIGQGYIYGCSHGMAPRFEFWGSNEEDDSIGHLRIFDGLAYKYQCGDGTPMTYRGEAKFPFHCEWDSQDNTTCTSGPFSVPVTNWGRG